MNPLFGQPRAVGTLQQVLWCTYLVAAVVLPLCHVRPILKYLRGTGGIGDACIRTEAVQCLWRVPALLFSMFVVPSLPLFLSIFLDLIGRIGRVLAMAASQRRWEAARGSPEHLVGRLRGGEKRVRAGPDPAYKPSVESDTPFVTLSSRPKIRFPHRSC